MTQEYSMHTWVLHTENGLNLYEVLVEQGQEHHTGAPVFFVMFDEKYRIGYLCCKKLNT